MKAARRVPWANKAELAELYEFLFSTSSDDRSMRRGLARMSIYISSPSCPSFMHLLYELISALLLSTSKKQADIQVMRMTCAMAIVRFVNGMVDPQQTGPYARPISHIAASLGIPPTLISLRHRATHEDLPPLPLLLNSIRRAIVYLHHNAFLPMLASGSQSPRGPDARTIKFVGRWKKAMKTRIREKDVREDSESGKELRRLRREIDVLDEGDLVEVLCGLEGLVPTGRTKRSTPDQIIPPNSTQQIWQPLIELYTETHPTFPSTLADKITSILTTPPISTQNLSQADLDPGEQRDEKSSNSWRWTLATWLLWLWRQEDGKSLAEEDKIDIWRRVLLAVLDGDAVISRFVSALQRIDNSLPIASGMMGVTADPASPIKDDQELSGLDEPMNDEEDPDTELKRLEDRLLTFEKHLAEKQTHHKFNDTTSAPESSSSSQSIKGWRLVPSSEWKASPIGIWA